MSVRSVDHVRQKLPVERDRGTLGMILFIVTEGALFLMLFFAYYYLAANNPEWPLGEPPELRLASIMTVLLVSSSVVLHLGERQMERGRAVAARLATAGALLLGVAFAIVQVIEYRHHLQSLTPRTNAYGSIFYTITSFHAAHLGMGLFMLSVVLMLPRLESGERPPYRSLHNVALYWHFVDVVWIIIICTLYVAPNLRA